MTHCHHDDPSHAHTHEHHHHDKVGKLRWALVLTAIYFWAELFGGIWSGSLALLADSGHMFSDLAGIALALFAAWISGLKISSRQTYGLYRVEILVAFINGLLLAGVASLILVEGWSRLHEPHAVQGPLMLWIAVGGFVINLLVMNVLHADHHHDLNVKGAYLHVLGDLLGSAGTILAALLLNWYGWTWADPVISMVIALLVLFSAFRLLMDATHILLESAPHHLNVEDVQQALEAVDGVDSVHDLHIWTISSNRHALSAHISVDHQQAHPPLLKHLQHLLQTQFSLHHVTLQLEPKDSEGNTTYECGQHCE